MVFLSSLEHSGCGHRRQDSLGHHMQGSEMLIRGCTVLEGHSFRLGSSVISRDHYFLSRLHLIDQTAVPGDGL